MNATQKLEQAASTLASVVDRYQGMGWFDTEYADADQMAEAKEMEDALEAGDEIAVGVALDRAMERFDCMGAFTCDKCGQDYPESGCVHVPCECGDTLDQLAEEAIAVKTALEILRADGNDEVPAPVVEV